MIRALAIVLFMMFAQRIPGPGGKVPSSVVTHTHVQSCNSQAGALPTILTCVFSSNITSSHLIYVCYTNFDAAISSPSRTYTITGGGTVTPDANFQNFVFTHSGNFFDTSCFYILNATGGSTTLSATATGTVMNFTGATGDEWTGIGTLDTSDTGNVGSGSSMSSHSITTALNGELVVGIFAANGDTITAGAGFTAGATSTFPSFQEYQLQSTAGAISATATESNAGDDWIGHVIAFK